MNIKAVVGWVVAVAAVNTGLAGALGMDIVGQLVGTGIVATVVYGAVGLAGLYKIYNMTIGKKK